MNIYILDPELFDLENTINLSKELDEECEHNFFTVENPFDLKGISENHFILLDISKGTKKPKLLRNADIDETDEMNLIRDHNLGDFLKQCRKFVPEKKIYLIVLPLTNDIKEYENNKGYALQMIDEIEKEI